MGNDREVGALLYFCIDRVITQDINAHIKLSPPSLVLLSLHTGYSVADEDRGEGGYQIANNRCGWAAVGRWVSCRGS